jgi:putative phosphoesterase
LRIGLISDTHVPESGAELWPEVYEAFLGINPTGPRVDLILHAGDMHVLDVLDWLEERVGAPVLACRGNGDDGDGGRKVVGEDARLNTHQLIEVGGFRVGLTHAVLLPEVFPELGLEVLMSKRFGGRVDILVHGDTHVADIRVHKGVLCVNSGSPVFPRNLTRRLGTIGFIDIESGRVHPWIHQLQ